MEVQFLAVVQLIKQSRNSAIRAVNTELINLYWNIGAYINQQLASANWGDKTVVELAKYIDENYPDLKGFNRRGLYRMRQFYETYAFSPIVSPVATQLQNSDNQLNEFVPPAATQIEMKDIRQTILAKISWSHHLVIITATRIEEEREFYIRLCVKEQLFIGEEYKVQVGNSDFYLDLLFYHRGLQCLVNFELKNSRFKPEHLGQINFYLEALDRDVKKPNENPSIGILLCKGQDSEVVEYALSRSLSPTMVAEYKTQLPDKRLLQQKLHELTDGRAL
jgi:hypothetical protein